MCVHDNMFCRQQKANKRKELCWKFHGEGRKREYYEWFVANAFVNNNKINGYDNNILLHRGSFVTHFMANAVHEVIEEIVFVVCY